MKKILALVLVFAGLFSAAMAQTAKPQTANGLLYKISGKNLTKPSYVFGTIHVICPEEVFGMETLEKNLQETDRLLLELDFDDKSVIQKAMTAMIAPEGKSLDALLSPEKYAKVDELFKSILGVSVGNFKQFSPFGLTTIVTVNPKTLGCPAPASYELKLTETAAKYKKDVEGIESVEEQMAAISKTSLEKQAEDLYKLALEPEKTRQQIKQLTANYKLQDSEKIAEYIKTGSVDMPDFQKNLVDERNAYWIPRLEKAITEKPTFIAVGAGHLGGEKGILNLLRKQGYKIEMVKL